LAKLGVDAFEFSILEECSATELDDKEKYWIQFYDTINTGYNLVPGGQSYRGIENPSAKLIESEV
jgi:hypothetical protein